MRIKLAKELLKIAKTIVAYDEITRSMTDLMRQIGKRFGDDKMKEIFSTGDRKSIVFFQNNLVNMINDLGHDARLKARGFEIPEDNQFKRLWGAKYVAPEIGDEAAAAFTNLNDSRQFTYARKVIMQWAKDNYGIDISRSMTANQK